MRGIWSGPSPSRSGRRTGLVDLGEAADEPRVASDRMCASQLGGEFVRTGEAMRTRVPCGDFRGRFDGARVPPRPRTGPASDARCVNEKHSRMTTWNDLLHPGDATKFFARGGTAMPTVERAAGCPATSTPACRASRCRSSDPPAPGRRRAVADDQVVFRNTTYAFATSRRNFFQSSPRIFGGWGSRLSRACTRRSATTRLRYHL